MFYVEVQDLDYDDYPQGSPVKIGPFRTDTLAEAFLTASPHFYQSTIFGDYKEWKKTGRRKHSVRVLPIADGFRDPALYLS